MTPILLAFALLAQDVPVTDPGEDAEPVAVTEQIEASAPDTPEPTGPVSQIALELLNQVPTSLEAWAPEGRALILAVRSFAQAGREDLVEALIPGSYAPPPCLALEGEGLASVVEAARSAQIVMINEAYIQPLHRWTVQKLGEALAGDYTVYAAETFNYLRVDDPEWVGPLGLYDREPIFARQVRAFAEADYRLAAYQVRAHQRDRAAVTRDARLEARGAAQLLNLTTEILSETPEARVLIHVNTARDLLEAGPAVEGEGPSTAVASLAMRLREATGLDPITISQTLCGPPASNGEEAVEAGQSSETGSPGGLVLVDPTERMSEGTVDFAIAHPSLTFINHRPAWRREMGDVEVAIPAALLSSDQLVIYEVRAPGQSFDHMPVDRLLLYPGETAPLLVPSGEWVVTAWMREGVLGEPLAISVP